MSGRVTLVGAGPGAADLLTLRAVDRLRTADVVFHDRLVSDGVLAHVASGATVVPVGKRPGEPGDSQRRILELLVAHAGRGRYVVRLKGGDPMVFGRGGEELRRLVERGVAVEVVPGITSAVGVPSSLGLPLTLRGVASSFAVVAGQVAPDAGWPGLATVDTLVVLMGVSRRTEIAGALVDAGRGGDTPVAFIERGATIEQRVRVATLAEVAAGRLQVASPAVWVIGGVVEAVDWSSAVHAPVGDALMTDPARAIA